MQRSVARSVDYRTNKGFLKNAKLVIVICELLVLMNVEHKVAHKVGQNSTVTSVALLKNNSSRLTLSKFSE